MIPYNPSSFDRNKTILEQILELKNWLKEHPSYKIYYIYDDYDPNNPQYTWSFSDITSDPTGIAQGDVILFKNSYYAMVYSVDLDNQEIGITPAESFQGPQGPQGATGPAGQNGVSVTNAVVDGNGDLQITLSSGTTINAGHVEGQPGTYTHYLFIPNDGYVLSNDEFAIAQEEDAKILSGSATSYVVYEKEFENSTYIQFKRFIDYGVKPIYSQRCRITKATQTANFIYDYVKIQDYNIDSETATSGQVLTADGSGGASWSSVPAPEGTAVKSTGATSGQVLTADGSDGASWQTPSGGTFDNYVIVSATSGTLSDADYNKLIYNNSVLIRQNGNYYYSYNKAYEDNAQIYFDLPDKTGFIARFTINKTTKNYSHSSVSLSAVGGISSGSSTSGQVLTADGIGGASWQTPSGGGGKYQHNISLVAGSGSQRSYLVFSFINDVSTAYTSITSLLNDIESIGGTFSVPASGTLYNDGNTCIILREIWVSTTPTTNVNLRGNYSSSGVTTNEQVATKFGSSTPTDYVVTL